MTEAINLSINQISILFKQKENKTPNYNFHNVKQRYTSESKVKPLTINNNSLTESLNERTSRIQEQMKYFFEDVMYHLPTNT